MGTVGVLAGSLDRGIKVGTDYVDRDVGAQVVEDRDERNDRPPRGGYERRHGQRDSPGVLCSLHESTPSRDRKVYEAVGSRHTVGRAPHHPIPPLSGNYGAGLDCQSTCFVFPYLK